MLYLESFSFARSLWGSHISPGFKAWGHTQASAMNPLTFATFSWDPGSAPSLLLEGRRVMFTGDLEEMWASINLLFGGTPHAK